MSQRSCWAPARAGRLQQKKQLELQSRCAHSRVSPWPVLRFQRLSKSCGLRKRCNSDSTSLRLMLLPLQQDAGVRINASWRMTVRMCQPSPCDRERLTERCRVLLYLLSASVGAWSLCLCVPTSPTTEQARPAFGLCRSSPGRWAWRQSPRHNTHLSLTRCATMKRYSCPRGASKPPPMMWRAFYGAARALASGTRPFLGA